MAGSGRGGPRRAHLAAVVAMLCGLAAPVGAQAIPKGYDEGVFDLFAEGLPASATAVLVSPRGTYLVPATSLLTAFGIPFTIVRDSSLLRIERPDGTPATLRWGVVRAVDVISRVPVDSGDILPVARDIYVAAPVFGRLIEGTVDVDLATLTLRARRDGGFPAQIRLTARERRAEAVRLAAADAGAAPSPAVPFEARSGFGVAEWSVGGPYTPFQSPTGVDLRVGGALFGGMLKTHGSFRLAAAEGAAVVGDASYQRVFPEGSWLRQVQLGDILSEGAEARSIRGLAISNAPFVRGMRFGSVAFDRPLPAGWEYELYEGDRLIGFADASGGAPPSVPLLYGTTPLTVKLYGPAGQVSQSVVTYVIPVDQLPAGEWQYATGAGHCALGQCNLLWYGDLRRGVTRTLTVQAGMDGTSDSLTSVRRAYLGASWIPAPEWALSAQARERAYLRGSVSRAGVHDVTGSLAGGVSEPGQGGISVNGPSRGLWFVSSTARFAHLAPALGERVLSVSSRYEHDRGGAGRRWDTGVTTPVPHGLLELGVQSDPLADIFPDSGGGPIVRIAPALAVELPGRARAALPLVRVEAGFQGAHLRLWDTSVSLQTDLGFGSLSLRHSPGIPGTQVVLGASLNFGAARVLSRLASRGGRLEGGYSANGAVAFGSVRRAMPLRYGGLGMSGVEGEVFRDVDGNGVRGPGDKPAANVIVRIGGIPVRTDSAGRYSTWNATPYEILDVQLDTLSLDDPSWAPAIAARRVRPSPQQFTGMSFALLHTREMLGRLAVDAGMIAPAGVTVRLLDSLTGAAYETRTFGDGGFYVGRVRPGRYRLSVSASSLRALDAAPPAVEVTVPSDGEEAIELPVVQLHRARAPATSSPPPTTHVDATPQLD